MNKIFFIAVILIFPLLVFAQDAGKKKAYYFFGEQCSHCVKVDEFFKANGIYDKYDITKLEFSNPFNARLLVKFGEAHNSEYKGSVPAVAFGDKFIVGDQPIIDNFVREIDLAGNANELPNPDAVGNPKNIENKGNAANQENRPADNAPGGNKNRYFPVILIALVLVAGAALVHVNRKK